MQDKLYETRWKLLPEIISEWVRPYLILGDSRILDFGCGDGATSLGFAMNHQPKEILGVEVQDEELNNCIPRAKLNLNISDPPKNFSLRRIEPGQSLESLGKFDLIFAWSVFEHVEQAIIKDALLTIKNALNPNGLIFIQIAPLYYSAFGSHLGEFVKEPWAHLKLQHSLLYQELKSKCTEENKQEELINCYETLNRVTADELLNYLVDLDFEIVRDYRTQVEGFVPEKTISNIYDNQILMTEQIVILAKLKSES